MNLPNKLTVMRMILIPFFVFFMLDPYFEGYGNYIAVAIFIIAREFIISGFRLVVMTDRIVIAASYWGKFKTVFQMLMVIVLILNIPNSFFAVLGTVLTYIALALTVVSLIDYIAKNKNVLKEQK